MFRTLVGTVAISALTAGSAWAGPVTIQNIGGQWTNPNNGNITSNTNASGSGLDTVRWGDGEPDSGYDFDPVDGSLSPSLSTPFLLGVFRHINHPIPSGSSITDIDYSFSFGTNGSPSTLNTVFSFDHFETTNQTPCPGGPGGAVSSPTPCDDFVTIAGTLNQLITVGGQDYFFNLLGFSSNAGSTYSNVFQSVEGGITEAGLYGMLTSYELEQTPAAVPEPASLTLVGTGILAAFRARRRRQQSQKQ